MRASPPSQTITGTQNARKRQAARPAAATPKERYLDAIGSKPQDALLVSLADKIHNAEAILNDLHFHGHIVWDRFNGGKDGSLWYYRALSDAFERGLPGSGAGRLKRAVDALHDHNATI